MVPAADAHCLHDPPARLDAVVDELGSLPAGELGVKSQYDRLAAAYELAYQYEWRAWRLCGSVEVP